MRRVLLGVEIAALAVCSTVTRITPAAAGLTVAVLNYDDQLHVRTRPTSRS